jgi:hypothetical protein
MLLEAMPLVPFRTCIYSCNIISQASCEYEEIERRKYYIKHRKRNEECDIKHN